MRELWLSADERLSSTLLRIECVIAIRLASLLQGGTADDAWVQERLGLLSDVLDELNFKPVDSSIEEIIRDTPALADCRTLDAIHVATALHFKTFAEGPFEFVTLDKRMKQLAKKVGHETTSRFS
jgi:predicted nucleic acid-binding protein